MRPALLIAVALVAGACGSAREQPPPRAPVAASASPAPTASPPAATPTPTPVPSLPTAAELRTLVREVAGRTGGRVQLAVTRGGRVAAAASSGPTSRPFRMWSVSKVATTIALLEEGTRLRGDVEEAVENALVGSGDCAQRQLVVELQERTGGIEPARRAVAGVLRRAGARRAVVSSRAAPPSAGCRAYLGRTRTRDPYRVALQLGTATWTITDAARFGLALGDGTYPPAVTRKVTALLRRAKRHSDDPNLNGLDVSTRLDWGAGEALGDLRPAYKAGWGGSSGETPTFVNEQVIFVTTPAGRYGIAVTFEPPDRPARDDPGLTRAGEALAATLRGLRAQLR